jgi:hypothetical protein
VVGYLDVSVNDIILVQVQDCQAHFQEVEPCLDFVHFAHSAKLLEQFATGAVFNPEDDPSSGLECTEQFAEEGMRFFLLGELYHDIALVLDDLVLIVLGDEGLGNQFKGHEDTRLLASHQEDPREPAYPDAQLEVEAVKR